MRTPLVSCVVALLVFPAQAQQPPPCYSLAVAEDALKGMTQKPMIEWDVQVSEDVSRTVRMYGSTGSGDITIVMLVGEDTHRFVCIVGTGKNMRIAPQFKAQEHPL